MVYSFSERGVSSITHEGVKVMRPDRGNRLFLALRFISSLFRNPVVLSVDNSLVRRLRLCLAALILVPVAVYLYVYAVQCPVRKSMR